jgi:uncharacterized protein with ACT and thioredoxin-like domain
MTRQEFNEKWKDHLEDGHDGLGLDAEEIVDYLDKNFTIINQENPNFTYSQIKMKFGSSRCYINGIEAEEILVLEHQINKLYNEIRNKEVHGDSTRNKQQVNDM